MSADGTAPKSRRSTEAADGLHRSLPRLWPLWLASLLLLALWSGPLPSMARQAFSPHMILHLGVGVFAAPLLAIGLLRAGFGPPVDRPLAAGLMASAFEMMVVWGWHAPVLHEAAALDTRIFVLQQGSFLLAGYLVWATAFSGASRASHGIGAFIMLLTFMHMAMLGVLLTLPDHLIYSPDICRGSFGLDRLNDQRLGGALMAVGGSLPYLVGATVLSRRMLAD